jgi:hypothetical protein
LKCENLLGLFTDFASLFPVVSEIPGIAGDRLQPFPVLPVAGGPSGNAHHPLRLRDPRYLLNVFRQHSAYIDTGSKAVERLTIIGQESFMPNRKTFDERDKVDHSSHPLMHRQPSDLKADIQDPDDKAVTAPDTGQSERQIAMRRPRPATRKGT